MLAQSQVRSDTQHHVAYTRVLGDIDALASSQTRIEILHQQHCPAVTLNAVTLHNAEPLAAAQLLFDAGDERSQKLGRVSAMIELGLPPSPFERGIVLAATGTQLVSM